MRTAALSRAIVLVASSLCYNSSVIAEPGFFKGKIVFFGAKKLSDDVATVFAWLPPSGDLAPVASFGQDGVINGRTSPDGELLATTVASAQSDGKLGSMQVVLVDPKGTRRSLAEDAELVEWFPDSKSVLGRRGEEYKWSHVRVDIDDGHQSAVQVDSKDAAMDISFNDAICVMKGRPSVLWERAPGDFYPKRQLYFISSRREQFEPFTDANEDCIWWRFKPADSEGVYYRRHYATGRPVETAMLGEGANHRQLVNFTELGVRPNGSPIWNPNGKEIAWIVERKTNTDDLDFEIMLIPVSGGQSRFVTAKELGLSRLGKIDWK